METLMSLVRKGWKIREANFAPDLYCVYPQKTQAVSVTGCSCELNCAHCGGQYLKRMIPLAAWDVGQKAEATSMLVSGGCTADGSVPVGKHLAQLQKIKQSHRLNLHVGLLDAAAIPEVAAMVDKISFDFVGDDRTIREVYGLERTVADYSACYRKLRQYCSVVPHICIGLNGGAIGGEYRALEILRALGAEALILIVFIPTRGTRFADRQPPQVADVLEVLVTARQMFPDIPLHLGCMRPGGRYRDELDRWAVRAGVNRIVNPVPAAVDLAEQMGLVIRKSEECCVL